MAVYDNDVYVITEEGKNGWTTRYLGIGRRDLTIEDVAPRYWSRVVAVQPVGTLKGTDILAQAIADKQKEGDELSAVLLEGSE